MRELKKELLRLVIHKLGTEKLKTYDMVAPRYREEDYVKLLYFNPHRQTWSTEKSDAYTGLIQKELEPIVKELVKNHLIERGDEN